MEDELAELKLEGERNNYIMPHLLSPELRDRYSKWSSRKNNLDRQIQQSKRDDGVTDGVSASQKLFESVLFLLVGTSFLSFVVLNKFLGSTFTNLIHKFFGVIGVVVLYNVKFCFGNSCVYFLAFTALQSKDTRRRQTLFNTRVFGMVLISLVFTLITLTFFGGCAARGWIEGMLGFGAENAHILSNVLLARIASCMIATSTIFVVLVLTGAVFVNKKK